MTKKDGKNSNIVNVIGVAAGCISVLLAGAAFLGSEIRQCFGLEGGAPDALLSFCPATRADYTQLERLLADQKFLDADIETRRLLQEITGLGPGESVSHQNERVLDKLKCQHLQTIDGLWLKYSDNKFGLSVQKNIYYSNLRISDPSDGHREAFGNTIGWRKDGSWLKVGDLNPTSDSPLGYLPSRTPGPLPVGSSDSSRYSNLSLRDGHMSWLVIDDAFKRCL